jgi:transposase
MGALTMSVRDRVRLEVFSRVRDGQITVTKAAALLKLSIRQARRLWRRYETAGDGGLVHGLRGKPSNRKVASATREAVLKLYREHYHDFGPTLACEHLSKRGHVLDRETLRRWLVAEGLWQRRRHRAKHRSRRERRAHLGELVQMDGSHHDWFEGRAAWCVLMVMIDDATGRTFCRFVEGETTAAVMAVFGAYTRTHGLPRALYVDRDSIYRSDRQQTLDEALRAASPLTQFGRAMKRLGVEMILANSPQAKGRVERMNRTLQDRLVKEMRLAKVNDIAAGNAFLAKTFLRSVQQEVRGGRA